MMEIFSASDDTDPESVPFDPGLMFTVIFQGGSPPG